MMASSSSSSSSTTLNDVPTEVVSKIMALANQPAVCARWSCGQWAPRERELHVRTKHRRPSRALEIFVENDMVEELGLYSAYRAARDSSATEVYFADQKSVICIANSGDCSSTTMNERVQPMELRGALAICKSHGAAIEVLTWIVRDAGLDPGPPEEVARSIDAASGGIAAFSDDMFAWTEKVLAGIVAALDAAVMPGRARTFPGTAPFFDNLMIDIYRCQAPGLERDRDHDELNTIVKKVFRDEHLTIQDVVWNIHYEDFLFLPCHMIIDDRFFPEI